MRATTTRTMRAAIVATQTFARARPSESTNVDRWPSARRTRVIFEPERNVTSGYMYSSSCAGNRTVDLERPLVSCFTDASAGRRASSVAFASRYGTYGDAWWRTFAASMDGAHDVNRLELVAILAAVRLCDPEVNLLVHTDSQVALDRLVASATRDKFNDVVDLVLGAVREREGTTLFCKVKAHSRNPGNELADLLASEASCASPPDFSSLNDFVRVLVTSL